MIIRAFTRLAVAGLLMLILTGVFSVMTAANTVPVSGLADTSQPITANDLKPPECAALNLVNIVTGSGNFNGSSGNDLILGSAGADNINGQGGADCMLGGGGNDSIRGGNGADVLNGGPGTDTCRGGTGVDTFISCETQFP